MASSKGRMGSGGRLEGGMDAIAARLNASVSFDHRLALVDIAGSLAHARMLASVGVLTAEDFAAIEGGLSQVRGEVEAGTLEWSDDLEDVHMNIEARLVELVGDAGKRLHTGRSRNDQVATDLRMWVAQAAQAHVDSLDALLRALVGCARRSIDIVMPGYTHLQRAQPVRAAHHVLAWAERLWRDRQRLARAGEGALSQCPMGAAALAGTPFPLDRDAVAAELGFAAPAANSMDAVASRDFALEYLAAASILMVGLSRIGEELVLWTSSEFGFIDLPDAFCTSSSIMPQKKNPDIAELVRAKVGRVAGALQGLLIVVKGLPLAYNKDLQEDKEPVFDTADTVALCLGAMTGLVDGLDFRKEACEAAAAGGYTTATDVADWLVVRGLPFREAHAIVGAMVKAAARRAVPLSDLSDEELSSFHPLLDATVRSVLDPARSVEGRDLLGGPARARVDAAIEAWAVRLSP